MFIVEKLGYPGSWNQPPHGLNQANRLGGLFPRAVPTAQVCRLGQLRLAVEKIVSDHAVQVVIDEQGPAGERIGGRGHHVVDRQKKFREVSGELLSVTGPFLDEAFSELPFLVTDQHDALDQWSGGNHIGIVQVEPHHLQIGLKIARQNQLDAFERVREKAKLEASINVARNFLPKICPVTDRLFPIDDTGQRMAAPMCGLDNGSPLVIGDVAKAE